MKPRRINVSGAPRASPGDLPLPSALSERGHSGPGQAPKVNAPRTVSRPFYLPHIAPGVWFRRAFLAVAIWCAVSGRAADKAPPGFEEPPPRIGSIRWQLLQEHMQREQQRFVIRVPIPDAVKDEVDVENPDEARRKQTGGTPEVRSGMAEATRSQTILAGAVVLLLGLLVIPRIVPRMGDAFMKRFDPWAPNRACAAASYANLLAEDQALKEFMAAFTVGPGVRSNALSGAASSPDAVAAKPAFEALREFFVAAPLDIAELRHTLSEIGRQTEWAPRQEMLRRLAHRLHVLKGKAGLLEVLPAWQVISALEGMLKQLVDRAKTVTLSSLRTLANGVDLLSDLCRPGVDPHLATDPPFRLLTVDDDPISLRAVSRALSKALHPPDEAKNGEDALSLTARRAYDVIFLDIQMPGMDGFEVCSKILEMEPNRAVPVVFVTCQSDFDSRAKSILVGGNDLIAKPFLNFEVTVKALTLALRSRLERKGQAASSRSGSSPALLLPAPAAVEPGASTASADSVAARAPNMDAGEDTAARCPCQAGSPNTVSVGENSVAAPEPVPEELAKAFFTHAPARLQAVRELAEDLARAKGVEARQEMLAELYLRLHSFGPPPGLPELRAASKLRFALDALIKRLLADPTVLAGSALQTIVSAADLLGSLCVRGLSADLATSPPVRILVVDDDPLSRRIMVGALQVLFEQPDSVGNGEDALVLAAKEPFDVIFLDVVMPGMDGFAVCSKIREKSANRDTPVIFVTGRADLQARAEFARSGGNELLAKPFLGVEITLKALTFALRGRLLKSGVEKAGAPRLGATEGEKRAEKTQARTTDERAGNDRRSARQKRHAARRKARRLMPPCSHRPDYS